MAFGGFDLYPTLIEKASSPGFSLVKNHPFLDGNKRIGHAAMESFLLLNGFEINAAVDAREKVILDLAAGAIGRDEQTDWLRMYVVSV